MHILLENTFLNSFSTRRPCLNCEFLAVLPTGSSLEIDTTVTLCSCWVQSMKIQVRQWLKYIAQ